LTKGTGGTDASPSGEQFDERRLEGTKDITLGELEAALDSIWKELKQDPKARAAALEAGVPQDALVADTQPFTLRQTDEGFEPITTFLVGVATGVAVHYTKKALDPLWDYYIAPKLAQFTKGKIKTL